MHTFISLHEYANDWPALAGIDGIVMLHDDGAVVFVESIQGFRFRAVEFLTRASEDQAAAFGHEADDRCPYFDGPYIIDHLTSRLLPSGEMTREDQELFLFGLLGEARKQKQMFASAC